nr:hypothetical protein [Tanacetum cinerariifolium]
MKSSTTNVKTSINEEVFHEVSKSFQRESSSSSLNDDVQQSSEEFRVSSSNTQSISNNMVPNVNEASTSRNVFNECSIELANVDEALRDADWVNAMQEELDQFARLKDFTVFQMDVKTTFLNGILKEEVDDDDQNDDDDDDQDDDDERTNSDNDGDDFVHLKFFAHNEEDKEEESFYPLVQTHSHVETTDNEDNDEDSHGMNVEGDEGANE